jgi:hypothetical protein
MQGIRQRHLRSSAGHWSTSIASREPGPLSGTGADSAGLFEDSDAQRKSTKNINQLMSFSTHCYLFL